MSRRSGRLKRSGYYRNEDKDDTNRTTISYHETPVGRIFKKRMGARRACYSSSNVSVASSCSSSCSEELSPAEEFLGMGPALCSATKEAMSSFAFRAPAVVPPHFSAQPSEGTRFLRGGILAVAFRFLLDVLMLSRNTRHLRKPVLTAMGVTFVLTLGFGFWFFPLLVSNASTFRSSMDTPQAPSITVVQREIAFLKEGRWKQKHLIEELKTKLKDLKFSMRKDDLDKRVWFEQQTAGFHRQITEIKADVSSLHTAALKNLLKSQEQDYDKLKAELSTWLQQQLLLACRSQASAVPHAKLQEALKALQTRLMDRFREELAKEREDLWRSVLETVTGLIKQVADDTVQKALRLYRADGVGMADFALESIGSRIIHSRCSESYHSKLAVLSLFGIPLLDSTQGPRTIIQPEVYPGKCWALNGNHGFATISLAYPVCITHVTLEHLPKELSPTGQISNAPKEFSVYGMRDELEEEGTLLGMFVYDYDGEPVQTFELPEYARDVYPVVQLRVQSNWGHPAYTCIYRFRVHGQLRTVMHT